jgi:hypothetical protein
MKKLILIAAMLLIAGVSFSQTLKKGAVIAVSVSEITLKEGVTMEQYLDFVMNQMGPAFEKLFPGSKIFYMKGDRGENKDELGWLWYFDSLEARDRYFNSEGNMSEENMEEVMKWNEKLIKLGTTDRKFTDWVIL